MRLTKVLTGVVNDLKQTVEGCHNLAQNSLEGLFIKQHMIKDQLIENLMNADPTKEDIHQIVEKTKRAEKKMAVYTSLLRIL